MPGCVIGSRRQTIHRVERHGCREFTQEFLRSRVPDAQVSCSHPQRASPMKSRPACAQRPLGKQFDALGVPLCPTPETVLGAGEQEPHHQARSRRPWTLVVWAGAIQEGFGSPRRHTPAALDRTQSPARRQRVPRPTGLQFGDPCPTPGGAGPQWQLRWALCTPSWIRKFLQRAVTGSVHGFPSRASSASEAGWGPCVFCWIPRSGIWMNAETGSALSLRSPAITARACDPTRETARGKSRSPDLGDLPTDVSPGDGFRFGLLEQHFCVPEERQGLHSPGPAGGVGWIGPRLLPPVQVEPATQVQERTA